MESQAKDMVSNVEPETKISIGEEFVQWAEKSWNLRKAYNIMNSNTDVYNNERTTFDQVKPYLVDKINSLIKERLNID